MLKDGFYTVAFKSIEYGAGHRTFKVETMAEESNFAPGKTVIYYLFGSDNTKDYRGLGFVIDGKLVLWKKYIGDKSLTVIKACADMLITGGVADKAGKMYALESGNCCRCNRTLTDPLSIARGIGPTCWERE